MESSDKPSSMTTPPSYPKQTTTTSTPSKPKVNRWTSIDTYTYHMEHMSGWWKKWASVILYFASIILYFFDVVSDIVLGKTLKDEGVIIWSLMFLPVIATFALVLFKRCLNPYHELRVKRDYKLTLLGIDWLNLDDGSHYTTVLTIILITLRLHIVRVYILLIHAAFMNDKKKKKKLDMRMRAEMFMETAFESLPQCCVQLYLYGHHSTVSRLQIISFTLSTLNLVYTFSVAHAEREAEIYYNKPKQKHRSKTKIEGIEASEDVESDEVSLTKSSKQRDQVKFSKMDHSLVMRVLKVGDPPPKMITMHANFEKQKGANKYNVTSTSVKSKRLSYNIERTFFFWMRVTNMLIESPVFFLTAFPSISLFASLFGTRFLLLYIPVACHFVAEYWWWRPDVYKFVMNGSFHTMFLAFKFLERLLILAMICIWFLKVADYSSPMVVPSNQHLPSLVWPNPNPFLLAVSKYEKDGKRENWSVSCTQLHQSFSTTATNKNKIKPTSPTDQHILINVYERFTDKSICALDASIYIICVVFYMNFIGMIWEVINYAVFWTFKWVTKYEAWKDAHHCHDSGEQSWFMHLIHICFENKLQIAADLDNPKQKCDCKRHTICVNEDEPMLERYLSTNSSIT